MSAIDTPCSGLQANRRRAVFRAWHRGTREMDLLLGRFANAALSDLSEKDFGDFELLMDVPDHDLFAWIVGTVAAPANYDTPVFRRLRHFHRGGDRTV